jgi:hypothetical protein
MLSYNRLHPLLLKVCQSQPIPSKDMLNLLCQAIDIAEATLDEAITLADRDLLQQRRARLLYKSNYMPTEKIES